MDFWIFWLQWWRHSYSGKGKICLHSCQLFVYNFEIMSESRFHRIFSEIILRVRFRNFYAQWGNSRFYVKSMLVILTAILTILAALNFGNFSITHSTHLTHWLIISLSVFWETFLNLILQMSPKHTDNVSVFYEI